jgi:hypothetical protein
MSDAPKAPEKAPSEAKPAKASAPTAITPTFDEVRGAIAKMSLAEKRQLGIGVAVPDPRPGKTPKLSAALDPLGVEKAVGVIAAIETALAELQRPDGRKDYELVGDLGKTFPDVASAIIENARFRGISLKQSMTTALRFLESKHGGPDKPATA